MPTSKLKTTRYNESSSINTGQYMLITRFPESYLFEIKDNKLSQAFIEIGPIQAKRLIKNLTDALKTNGHFKE
jgi:hypothetical protein